MINEYVEYSGKDISEIEHNVLNIKEIINNDILSFENNIDLLIDSKNLIYDIIRYSFNTEKSQILAKYQLFSPYMMSLITSSGYNNFLEYMGGMGILSEIIKENIPSSSVTFNSINNEISNFAKWRFDKKGLNISVESLLREYDVIISDGFLQYLDSDGQENLLNMMINMTSKNGLLCLLIDISGEDVNYPLKKNVDILNIHSILEQSDMVCIYGKNTFSSLWKKMI